MAHRVGVDHRVEGKFNSFLRITNVDTKVHLFSLNFKGFFCEISFIGSIIFWQCSEDFGPVISILECSYPSKGGHTFERNSKHWSSRKNQLTFEAFELNPKLYIVRRDSFLTRLGIERPQRNSYAASAILNYNVVEVWYRSGIGIVSVWYRYGIGLVSVWYRSGIGLVSIW